MVQRPKNVAIGSMYGIFANIWLIFYGTCSHVVRYTIQMHPMGVSNGLISTTVPSQAAEAAPAAAVAFGSLEIASLQDEGISAPTPQKSNIDTKNCHVYRELPFPNHHFGYPC